MIWLGNPAPAEERSTLLPPRYPPILRRSVCRRFEDRALVAWPCELVRCRAVCYCGAAVCRCAPVVRPRVLLWARLTGWLATNHSPAAIAGHPTSICRLPWNLCLPAFWSTFHCVGVGRKAPTTAGAVYKLLAGVSSSVGTIVVVTGGPGGTAMVITTVQSRAGILGRLGEISRELQRLTELALASRLDPARDLHRERRQLMHELAVLPPRAEGSP